MKRVIAISVMLALLIPLNFTFEEVIFDDLNARISTVRAPDGNDWFNNATEITAEGNYFGSVNYSNDRHDFFKIYLDADGSSGDLVHFNFTFNNSGNIIMTISNPENYSVVDGFWSKGDWVEWFNVSFCASSTGYYYFWIQCYYIFTLDYSFDIEWAETTRSLDDDNTNNTATTAINGGSYNGDIDPVYDYLDLYNISVTSGSTVTEGLNITLATHVDKKMWLYNPDGTLRYSSDKVGSSYPNSPEEIMVAVDQTGIYKLAVLPSYGWGYDIPSPSSYILNLTIDQNIPPDTDYDKEHATLVFNGTMINDSFDSKYDEEDHYMIDLQKGEELTVAVLYKDWIWSTISIHISAVEPHPHSIGIGTTYTDKGGSKTGEAEYSERYYIALSNTGQLIRNYTVSFSTSGYDPVTMDDPMIQNKTHIDISTPEEVTDRSINLNDIFFDPDGGIEFECLSHPTGSSDNFYVNIADNGSVLIRPYANFNGYELFNFSATDDHDNVLYLTVNVTVTPINDPPWINDFTGKTWIQDQEVNITLNMGDADGDMLIITDNSSMFDIADKKINFYPTNEDVGTHYIGINVSDSEYTAYLNFTVEVENSNDDPYFIDIGGEAPGNTIHLYANEDESKNWTINVGDPDIDIGIIQDLEFSMNITHPRIKLEDGKLFIDPVQEDVGDIHLRIRVSDGSLFDDQNVTITVSNVNDVPEQPIITLESQIDLQVNLSTEIPFDEDGDNLTLTWDFGDGTTVDGLYVQHPYEKPGNYTITLTADDGNGGKNSSFINVTVAESSSDDVDDDMDDDIEEYFTILIGPIQKDGNNVAGAIVTITLPDGTPYTSTTNASGIAFFTNMEFEEWPEGTTFKVTHSEYGEMDWETKEWSITAEPVDDDDDDTEFAGLLIAGIGAGVLLLIIIIILIVVFVIIRNKKEESPSTDEMMEELEKALADDEDILKDDNELDEDEYLEPDDDTIDEYDPADEDDLEQTDGSSDDHFDDDGSNTIDNENITEDLSDDDLESFDFEDI